MPATVGAGLLQNPAAMISCRRIPLRRSRSGCARDIPSASTIALTTSDDSNTGAARNVWTIGDAAPSAKLSDGLSRLSRNPRIAERTGSMRNLRLTLAYDGTRYLGWQWQPYGPTIQGELQEAIRKLTGETVEVVGSGRTDAGVHALGQVANFLTSSPLPVERFLHGLSHYLPRDMVLREVAEVPPSFHAQFQAKKKRYRYILCDGSLASPFLRPYVWCVRGSLDDRAMHIAGQALVGRHDFRCFETKYPNKATSVRTIMELTVSRHACWALWDCFPSSDVPAGFGPEAESPRAEDTPAEGNALGRVAVQRRLGTGSFISLEVVADGFLWNMVRAITGTLVNVGLGKWDSADVVRILNAGERRLAGETAPALGLYLVHVDYDAGEATA